MSLQPRTREGKSSTSLFALNESAAQAFLDIASYLELKGENPFKIKAYVKASKVLHELDEDLEDLCLRGELRSIAGVGKTIADKLEAFIAEGFIPQLEALKEEIPAGLVDIAALPGLGAKKTILLHEELGVTSLSDLRAALVEQRVQGLKGFSKKSQEKLLAAVDQVLKTGDVYQLAHLQEWALSTLDRLQGIDGLDQVQVVGEVRRKVPQASGLELLLSCRDVASVREQIEERLTANGAECVLEEGSVRTVHPSGCPVVLHFCDLKESGWSLLVHTGPEEFVKLLQAKADSVGRPEGSTEEEAFAHLQLLPVVPELRHREDPWGDSEKTLLQASMVKGNLHAHTSYSDGQNSLLEMVEKARELGHRFFGVTDHSRSLVIANGMTPEALKQQLAEVETLDASLADFKVFAGNETDILADGSLDYSDELLGELDYVVAAVHSFFHLDSEAMTRRLLRGLSHPKVRIWAHPTGRIIGRRSGYDADWKAIFELCAERNVAVEINASPKRLDVSEEILDMAVASNCLIALNTDAHSVEGFSRLVYGVDMARRAVVNPELLVNTWSAERLGAWFATGDRS